MTWNCNVPHIHISHTFHPKTTVPAASIVGLRRIQRDRVLKLCGSDVRIAKGRS